MAATTSGKPSVESVVPARTGPPGQALSTVEGKDDVQSWHARQPMLTMSPSDGCEVRWFLSKAPLKEGTSAATVPSVEVTSKGEFVRFGARDSAALEAAYQQREEELQSIWWREYAEVSEGPARRQASSSGGGTAQASPQKSPGQSKAAPSAEPSQPPRSQDPSTSTDADREVFASGGRHAQEQELLDEVGVLVKGGLYEVHLERRRCSTIFWHSPDMRALRGSWFAQAKKGKLAEWLPVREDIAEQLEIAYRGHVWRRRTFQPTGMYAHRVELAGPTQGTYALFTGEDDTWEAFLGFGGVVSSMGRMLGLSASSTPSLRLRRGWLPDLTPPTQEEARQRREEEQDDNAATVPVGHLVFMVHGIGQRLQAANLVEDVTTFRELCSALGEQFLTDHQRSSFRVLFVPCQWRKSLVLGGERLVEDITMEGVKSLRQIVNATVLDVLYYMSPVYCQEIINSVSHTLNHLYLRFARRHPNFQGKVSIYGHSLGSVLTYDILCNQSKLFSLHSLTSPTHSLSPAPSLGSLQQTEGGALLNTDKAKGAEQEPPDPPDEVARLQAMVARLQAEVERLSGAAEGAVQMEAPPEARPGSVEGGVDAEELRQERAAFKEVRVEAVTPTDGQQAEPATAPIPETAESEPSSQEKGSGQEGVSEEVLEEVAPQAEVAEDRAAAAARVSSQGDATQPDLAKAVPDASAKEASSAAEAGRETGHTADTGHVASWGAEAGPGESARGEGEPREAPAGDYAGTARSGSTGGEAADDEGGGESASAGATGRSGVEAADVAGTGDATETGGTGRREDLRGSEASTSHIAAAATCEAAGQGEEPGGTPQAAQAAEGAAAVAAPARGEAGTHSSAAAPGRGHSTMPPQGLHGLIEYPRLVFHVDTFFAVGSPLGMFLALRNIRFGGGDERADMRAVELVEANLPACTRLFNIFHPHDPVAYRLEPLVSREYVGVRPEFVPYHKGGHRLHIGMQQLGEEVSAKSKALRQNFLSGLTNVKTKLSSALTRARRSLEGDPAATPPTLGPTSQTGAVMCWLTGSPDGRLDFALQDATFEHQYISALSAHTAYWRDPDTALFILRHFYRLVPRNPALAPPQPQEEDGQPEAQPSRHESKTERVRSSEGASRQGSPSRPPKPKARGEHDPEAKAQAARAAKDVEAWISDDEAGALSEPSPSQTAVRNLRANSSVGPDALIGAAPEDLAEQVRQAVQMKLASKESVPPGGPSDSNRVPS